MWGSKRWLAYGYHFFIGDGEMAEAAYEACFDYDPARVDCVVFLSRLYLASECTAAVACFLTAQPAESKAVYICKDSCCVPWRYWSENILTVGQ